MGFLVAYLLVAIKIYPVVGIVNGINMPKQWTAIGKFYMGMDSNYDLENIPPETKRIQIERWVNVYDEDELYWWPSKKTADKCAKKRRVACVKIVIDCVEGEGL